MTPKFLREEAARFRGMAKSSEREASRQRYLAMAVDFEARANSADASADPALVDPGPADPAPADPAPNVTARIRLSRKTAGEAKEQV